MSWSGLGRLRESVFTVAISAYQPARARQLARIIEYYMLAPSVSEIVVVWHNPTAPPPDALPSSGWVGGRWVGVRVWRPATDSLNNRFAPIPNVTTAAVLTTDDDIVAHIADLEVGFEQWRARPDALTGAFVRTHLSTTTPRLFTYLHYRPVSSEHEPRRYSIVLTKLMFHHVRYMWSYTCLLPEEVHRYVDRITNCEDIAFAMAVAGMSGAYPSHFDAYPFDFGRHDGLWGAAQGDTRSVCLSVLMWLMWRGEDRWPLSDISVAGYRADPLTVVPVDADIDAIVKPFLSRLMVNRSSALPHPPVVGTHGVP
eukprot:TRINITY_DN70624_c0_g1_i1.p1 TRINITY_DN70624_c0_g1~~TRINITY_DN70624_c0_g1_i1.p1  ORF type:complete len:312 (+),score=68.63 TRINITY_DN70624_c0_g1_i1:2-937(+)